METIVSLDISQIDVEIANLNADIKNLQHELEIKIGVKEYLSKYSLSKNEIPTNVENEKPFNIPTLSGNVGISDFIVTFLRENNKADSREIITAWAKFQNKSYVDVRNNVSNALSRLKQNNKIKAVDIDGLRGTRFVLPENKNEAA